MAALAMAHGRCVRSISIEATSWLGLHVERYGTQRRRGAEDARPEGRANWWSFAGSRSRTRGLRLILRAEHAGEERERLDPVRRVVRAGVDAARLLVLHAEVAAGRLLFRARDQASRLRRIGHLHRERVQVEVSVRAVAGAQAAPDAPVLDDDLHRVAAADRADRAPDHAQRIAAGPAGGRHQVLVEAQPFADEAG